MQYSPRLDNLSQENKMKTIFITSFHGLMSRVFTSGLIDKLLTNDSIRIVLFVPDFKKSYYKEIFNHPRIIIEGIRYDKYPKYSLTMRAFSFLLLRSRTMRIKMFEQSEKKNKGVEFFVYNLISFIGGYSMVRSFFRFLNYVIHDTGFFREYFEKYNPDLVFAADLKHIFDTTMTIEAKKRDIHSIGMIRSWDNLTAKGILRVLPDALIVHNGVLKKEAIYWNNVPEKEIFVSGIQHYDIYTNVKRKNRDEVCRDLGIDKNNKIIFYAPTGNHYSDTDWQVVRMLDEAITKKELRDDISFIVHLPPSDNVNWHNFNFSKRFVVVQPGKFFSGMDIKDNEMTHENCINLANFIYWSDVVIAGPSTIIIDATAFDKPTVVVGFDGQEKYPYSKSVKRYFDYNHLRNIVDMGGVSLVSNKEHFIGAINKYLNNSSLDTDGRRQIRNAQCGELNGMSSSKTAGFLLHYLDEEKN